MNDFLFNIEVLENGKLRHVVGDKIIAVFEIFQEDKVACCCHHCLIEVVQTLLSQKVMEGVKNNN